MLDVGCFPFLFSPRQPDQSAEKQNAAGQRAEQEPVQLLPVFPRDLQAEFRDGPRPDAGKQLVAVDAAS